MWKRIDFWTDVLAAIIFCIAGFSGMYETFARPHVYPWWLYLGVMGGNAAGMRAMLNRIKDKVNP